MGGALVATCAVLLAGCATPADDDDDAGGAGSSGRFDPCGFRRE